MGIQEHIAATREADAACAAADQEYLERLAPAEEVAYSLWLDGTWDGRMALQYLRFVHAADGDQAMREFTVHLLYGCFRPPHIRESLIRCLGEGAELWDLLALEDVHGFNHHGEDLPGLAAADLQRRMLAVEQRVAAGHRGRWLERYADLLAAESRRRRGI